jgi:hypothetical protein
MSHSADAPAIISHLSEISERYDALFCDLWGCVHNGIAPFPDAIAALQAFRTKGGVVVLVTNAPRAHVEIAKQLDAMGVPRDAWDMIATSGDSARAAMLTGAVGEKVYFIGEPRDDTFFAPMKLIENPVTLTKVDVAEAEGIVCTGPFDPHAEPDVLRPQLLLAKTRGSSFSAQTLTSWWTVEKAANIALAQWRNFTPRWAARAFISGSPTPPSMIWHGGAWCKMAMISVTSESWPLEMASLPMCRAGLAKVLIRCLSQAVWPAKKQRQPISQIQKNLLNI